MVLRYKSLAALGRSIRLPAGLKALRGARTPRKISVPQERLWSLIKARYPDAEHEKAGLVPGRRFTVDIVIERFNLVAELDGWAFHGKHKAGFLRDREKDRLLLLAGFRVVRFAASEVMKDPTKVMETLSSVVAVIEKERIKT